MSNSSLGIAKQYAKSVIKIIHTIDLQNEVIENLNLVLNSLNANLKGILFNSWTSRKYKLMIWHELAKNFTLHSISLSLIETLLKNHRFNIIGLVIDELQRNLCEKTHKKQIVIETATSIPITLQKDLENILTKVFNSTLLSKFIINSSIVGGMIAYSDEEIIDISIRSRINQLKKAFHIL